MPNPHNKKYPDTWKCIQCQKSFPNKTGHPRKYCSHQCYWRHMKGRNSPGNFQSGNKHWNYRGGKRLDRTNSCFNYPMYRKIAKKCNYTCQICGQIFPRQPIYKIRNIISIDHIVPIKLGGEHSIKNGQLLCRPCNKSKSHNDYLQIFARYKVS